MLTISAYLHSFHPNMYCGDKSWQGSYILIVE